MIGTDFKAFTAFVKSLLKATCFVPITELILEGGGSVSKQISFRAPKFK